MPHVLPKAALVALLATSASLAPAQPISAASMQPVDWYTNAVTADQARSREDADRDYYNRQYYDRQYENQRYNNQLYNRQYYNRQYYNRQYYNREYYRNHR
jgi:hypothetical protein